MKNGMFLALLFAAAPVLAQVHLITGDPIHGTSRSHAATLLRVSDDGTVQLVEELAPEKDGVEGITLSYDAGLALIESKRTVVVDLATAQVVKSCKSVGGPSHSIWLYGWLLNVPSKGAFLAEQFANLQDDQSTLMGTLLDPAVECGKSRAVLDPHDLRYVSVLGRPLIADVGKGDNTGLFSLLESDGSLRGVFSQVSYSYGYQLPPAQQDGLAPRGNVGLIVNNGLVMVFTVPEKTGGQRVLAVLKKDNSWHRVPVPTTRPLNGTSRVPQPIIRGFGHFVAMAEVMPHDIRNPTSAGSSEWRKGESKTGPHTEYFFQSADVVFPGRLHIYDVETERSYTISTNQGDSEILLIENNTVYYRSSDRLYSVAIIGDQIGKPRLLASDDAIRDAHWAFIKH